VRGFQIVVALQGSEGSAPAAPSGCPDQVHQAKDWRDEKDAR
jgi:hypothetical protein